jgi:hypothetical protein
MRYRWTAALLLAWMGLLAGCRDSQKATMPATVPPMPAKVQGGGSFKVPPPPPPPKGVL